MIASHYDYQAVMNPRASHRDLDRLFVQWSGAPHFGTFLQDVTRVRHLAESVPERLLRVLVREGLFGDGQELSRMYGRTVRAYRSMWRFPGLEPFTDAVVNEFLLPLATTGFAGPRILAIVGPRSSGRRHFIEGLANLLDRNRERVPCLEHSEMRTNPLNLLFCIADMARRAAALDSGAAHAAEYACALKIMQALELDKLIEFEHPSLLGWCAKHAICPTLDGFAHRAFDDPRSVALAIVRGLGLTDATGYSLGYPDPAVWRQLLRSPDPLLAIANYPVTSFRPDSHADRGVGYCELHEIEPLNYDRSVLIAYDDLLCQPPRLGGAYCMVNRGILSCTSGFRLPQACLLDLRAAQYQELQLHTNALGGVFGRTLAFDAVTIVHDGRETFDRMATGSGQTFWSGYRDGGFLERPVCEAFKVITFPLPGCR